MQSNEIEFEKYKKRGAYHWEQDSYHIYRGNAFVQARYGKCVELAKNSGEGLAAKKVLDLGCGDGVLTHKLVEQGAICYGIDLSDIAIKFATEKHKERNSKAKFKCASVYETGFDDHFFDVVICSDVIEHLQEPERLLKEIDRILKVGGKAIISTPIKFTEKPLDPMHVVEWFPSEFRKIIGKVFEEANFCVSHPLCWFELFSFSRVTRIGVNALSRIKNPFLSSSERWTYFCLQYAIISKRSNSRRGEEA
jgi:2-polyprenyl-3-methyl-5-hydroxy-6-metoxy-1,4-benzoquinol methylase